MTRTRAVLAAVTLLGCSRRERAKEEVVRADEVVTASHVEDAPKPEAPLDFGPPGPVAIAPGVPKFVLGMMDHSDEYGWSKDGSTFGYCQTDGGMGARHCGLWPRVGTPERFDDIDMSKGEFDPKKNAAMAVRMKKLALSIAVPPPTWAYARDIELVWIVIEGDSMATPERAGVLKVGGRVKGAGEPPAYVVSLSETSSVYYSQIHPEAIAVSPDGQMLGVMGHAFAGEFSDAFVVALIPTVRIAAAAYEEAARAHQQKGESAIAAELFRKAKAAS